MMLSIPEHIRTVHMRQAQDNASYTIPYHDSVHQTSSECCIPEKPRIVYTTLNQDGAENMTQTQDSAQTRRGWKTT